MIRHVRSLDRDERDVARLVARFANSFDLKAWSELESCLAESIDTDYSDLRGTPPERMHRRRFVELRRRALQDLDTHHLTGNVEIALEGDRGSVRVSMAIYRRDAAGREFNTHCVYALGVTRADGQWRIASIVQKVLWSDGHAAIHRGIAGDV